MLLPGRPGYVVTMDTIYKALSGITWIIGLAEIGADDYAAVLCGILGLGFIILGVIDHIWYK